MSKKRTLIVGTVQGGARVGRQLGFPTANLIAQGDLALEVEAGVYLAHVTVATARHWAIVNVGQRPTVADDHQTVVEAHILDFSGDIYGERIEVELVTFLRPERKFESLELLRQAIANDEKFARNIINQKYKVADISLAASGRREISTAEIEMDDLVTLRKMYVDQRPLNGARITASLCVTAQTAVLIETLVELGAQVRLCSCDAPSTQDHVAAALAASGVPVFAWKEENSAEFWRCIAQALTFDGGVGPHLIADASGDTTLLIHKGVRAENAPQMLNNNPESPAEQGLVDLLRKTLASDSNKWHRLLSDLRGVLGQGSSCAKLLNHLQTQGQLLIPAINIDASLTDHAFVLIELWHKEHAPAIYQLPEPQKSHRQQS